MKEEFHIIANLIEKGKSILDVGCGDGELMEFICQNISKKVRGLEISKDNIQKCIKRGLTVIEGNAEIDLQQFPNDSYDYVILSQTLQAFLDPEKVLKDLMRVGKNSIVTIPNFGFWKVRANLLLKGTMPVTKTLPYEWFNTPNLHMCTIKDFVNFCKKRDLNLSKSLALTNKKVSLINSKNLRLKNLTSELGIFMIEK
tara:strand:+ start:24169 stop:24765 length:597 start_codon:yes stop_codon:yes gene_type:complete